MNERDVAVSFTRSGTGWADCTLRIGSDRFILHGFSYTTDALGDLVRAALHVASGGDAATVRLDREPAEWRLVLLAHHPMLFLRVLEFADIYEDAAVELGNECFKAECDLEAFALAVAGAAAEVLADATRTQWWGREPFPFRAFIGLQAALSAPIEPPQTSVYDAVDGTPPPAGA